MTDRDKREVTTMGTVALRKTPAQANRDVARLVAARIDSARVEKRRPQGFTRAFLMGDGSHVRVAWAVVVDREHHEKAAQVLSQ